jgi:ligand-binding sensor domain-containing protein/two-component sensor histidine kinase
LWWQNKTAFVLLAVICVPFLGLTQQTTAGVSFINYNVEDGLPSDEAYHVMQDSRGYIWISTDQGVARFDGQNFKSFSSRNGLPDDVIFQTFEDHVGRIWFSAFNCALSYLEGDEVYEFPFNEQLLDALDGNPVCVNLKVDKNDNVWVGYDKAGILKIDPKGNITRPVGQEPMVAQKFVDETNIIYGTVGRSISLGARNNKMQKVSLDHPNWKKTPELYLSGVSNIIRMACIEPDKICVTTGSKDFLITDGLAKLEGNLMTPIISNDYINGALWLGMASGGVQEIFVEKDQLSYGRHLLNGISVSHMFCDRQGGIWASTLEKGVFYCANPKIKAVTHNLEAAPLSLLEVVALPDSSGVYLNDRAWKVYNFSASGQLGKAIPLQKARGIFKMDEGVGVSSIGLYRIGAQADAEKISKHHPGRAHDFNAITNQIMCAGQFGVSLLDLNADTIRYYHIGRVFRAIFETDTTVLLARFDGVDRLNLATSELTQVANIKGRVEDLKLIDGELFIATRNNGLIIVSDDSTIIMNENGGLPTNTIYCISYKDKDRIWLGTRKGVVLLDRTEHKWKISCVDQFGGLLANRITSLDLSDSIVAVGTRKGLNIFNPDDIIYDWELEIFLDSIRIQGDMVDKKVNEIELSSTGNSIEFFTSGICFNCNEKATYKMYVNEKEIINESGHFELNDLASGEYKVRFMICDKKIGSKQLGVEFSINVLRPLWERPWFIVLYTLILLFGALLIMRIVLKRKMKRDKLISDTYVYQQRALSLQMKPHFIFNSMNSIQNIILTGKKREAHKYIASLARLMRSNLEHADVDYITLSDELDILQTYFELEQRRIEQEIELNIETDLSDSLELYGVPPFILQPLLENCIWHGFNDDEVNDPKIQIRVTEDMHSLVVQVEDNGIGLIKAGSKKSLGSAKSSAIINLRLELLEKQHNFNADFKISDLSTVGKRGTLVEFRMPLKKMGG